MAASRGDLKPCTVTPCTGTMQFGRRGDSGAHLPALQGPAGPVDFAMDTKGWVCNADSAHFRQAE